MLFDYDETDERSILLYAKGMENHTYNEILDECKEYIKEFELGKVSNRDTKFVESLKEDKFIKNTNAKGQLGNFIEKYYFGYSPNSHQEADLSKAGIEIKQTPIDFTTKGEMRAGERLSITMIPFDKPIGEDFYKSHLWDKIEKILLVHYIRDKSKERLDYQIKYVNIFTPPKEDLQIIIEDYKKINDKIRAGKAHELSESDTMYLGACTKGATASKSLREQYYNKSIKAKSRNFCFKQSYMNFVLNNYILNNQSLSESIIEHLNHSNKTFEERIIDTINIFKGKTDKELCRFFNREYNNNKAQWIDLAFRMLGIKSNRAEEFEKANIVVKTIRIEKNNKNRESISLPPFRFMDLINEEWDDSTVHNYFDETKFLFVVFKSNGECYEVAGARLWNMPYQDLEIYVKEGWLNIRSKIINGIHLHYNGRCMENDLPKKRDNPVIHIRPHAQKAAFKLNNGFCIGNIKRDANPLPNGEWMTTQSFWLNNDYVRMQIIDIIEND